MRSKIVVCLSMVVLLSMLVTGCSRGQGGDLRLPIKVEGADQVGSIAFRLLYDPTVLEITGVRWGPLALGMYRQWGTEQPGQLSVTVTDDFYLNGDGTLVEMHFEVLNSAGSSTLAIQVLEARSLRTGELLQTQVSEGSFSASDMSVEPLVIRFGA